MGAVAVNTEIEMDPAVFFFDDNWEPDAEQENPPILDEYSKTFEVADSGEAGAVVGSTPEEIQQENTELLELDHSAGLVLPEFQISTEPILNPSTNDTGTRMISVILRSTHDQEKDVRRMKSIQGLMQSSPGKDHFSFHIIEDGRRCLIEFPNHTTGITPSLLNRLEKLVGKSNYRIDPIIVH